MATTLTRIPLPTILLPILLILLPACSSQGLRSGSSADKDAEIAKLRDQIAELKREAAVSEVESRLLRQRLAAAEAEPSAVREPEEPAIVPPQRTRVVEAEPPPVVAVPSIEESDLAELPEVADELDPASPELVPTGAERVPQAGPSTAVEPQVLDEAGQALYDQGYSEYHRGRYAAAEQTFQRFVQEYSGTDLGDNAQYWIGESRLARGEAQAALIAFEETLARYPEGNKAPDALLGAARSLESLGNVPAARQRYQELLTEYPESGAATTARRALEALGRGPS